MPRFREFKRFILKKLVDRHYPQVGCIWVVLENLSTHTAAALYDTFDPGEVRRIQRHLEFHYVAKHANWLNMVEIGVFKQGCLARRIADRKTLGREITIWQARRNQAAVRIPRKFTTERAREKLSRGYRLPATGNHSSRSGKETSGRMNLSNPIKIRQQLISY